VAEVRAVAELSQRSSMMAKREVERLAAGGPPGPASPARRTPEGVRYVPHVAPGSSPAPHVAPGSSPAPHVAQDSSPAPHVAQGFSPAPAPASPAAGASDAYKYVGFEDLFRGSEDEIRARMRDYVPVFAGATDVLDVGCGRGELLALLKEAGIQARGLDLNHEMVEMCRQRGLDAAEGDALDYLGGLADESLGGLIASQVVEHFEPGYLVRFLETAYHKLRPGSKIVLETINPACWVAFFESYIRDLTHVRPLHPETLKFLLLSSGYATVDIVFRAPVPESGRLQPVTEPPVPPGTPDDAPVRRLVEWARTFNANVDRLNERMFTHLDYAAIGTKA
jgi:O-antigen chain-terminating methyltransferase